MKKRITRACLLISLILLANGCANPHITNEPTSTNDRKAISTTTSHPVIRDETHISATASPTTTHFSFETTASPTTTRFSFEIKPEDFHANITLRMDKDTYSVNDTALLEIENKTGGEISFGANFVILKQAENGKWIRLVNKRGIPLILYKMTGDGIFNTNVNLSPYELEANQQYKLALNFDEKWIGADFKTIA